MGPFQDFLSLWSWGWIDKRRREMSLKNKEKNEGEK